ncbi:prefoldin-like protein [Leptomonas seymouri]|uniref:Prefoldin subunit 3 n=1 Tax=Leptomonas seymouri TaxID=5684 RepID=A0A0N1PB38_LEPSE|nr:prefoldin-like protein [Leptomonas seymouri]|eukprot:KPI84941.1 prefoldin-like protein [Leptomonas seymouri]
MTSVLSKYTFKDDYVSPRGIPKVAFVENVAELVKSSGDSAETLLKRFSEQYSKYKLAEHRLIRTIANLEAKIPDIKKTLQTLEYLKKSLVEEAGGEGFTTNYGLTESVFCQAKVPPQKTVHVWLGANVMVEYTFDEATQLLEKNLKSATENLATTQEDLSWLQEQQTILEVNTSRLYNYDVMERRKKTDAEEKK